MIKAAQSSGPMPTIGFIGMGHMGCPMARRLVDAGYPVTVYNRNPAKAQVMADYGASVARSLPDLAGHCEIILSSLTNDAAVEEVYYGPNAVIDGVQPGSTVIELSTIAPEAARILHETLLTKGVACLDAGVSGSTPQAEQGTLTILAGGDEHAFHRCKDVLGVLGNPALFVGLPGSGKMMKLVINVLLGVGMQAMAEAIALGEKAGLDKDRLLDALDQTTMLAPGLKSRLQNAKHEWYPVNFSLRLMSKDFNLILRRAAEMAVPMPATAAAHQVCLAEQARGVEEDFSAVIRRTERSAGIPAPVHAPVPAHVSPAAAETA